MSSETDQPALRDARLGMLAALVGGDTSLAFRITTDLLSEGVPFDAIVIDVLGPVQAELGRKWAAGDLGIADEHAASAGIDELLVRLGATVEAPSGPTVVVASAEHDAHALGGRIVASALSLEGFRVLFLGASVPARDLADFLELHQPLALALSCSIPTALVGVAGSVAAAHESGVPVVAGGRALAGGERAVRLGVDAFARVPHDAVEILQAWELSPPDHLAPAPEPIPEHTMLARQSPMLISAALEVRSNEDPAGRGLAEELGRVLQVVEGALLIAETDLIHEHVHWLRETGPAHGLTRAGIDDALAALADAMDVDLPRAAAALRETLTRAHG